MTAETSNSRGEWVLVPRVPTEAMKVAALQQAAPLGEIVDWQFDIDDETVDREAVAGIYTAMLAAAPQPPSAPVGVEALARLDHSISVWAGRMSTPALLAKWPEARHVHEALVAERRALAQQPAAVDRAMEWTDEAAYAFRKEVDAVGAHWHPWPVRFRFGMRAALAAQHQEPTT